MRKLFDIVTFPFRSFLVIVITFFDSFLGLLGIYLLGKAYFRLNHYRAWAKRLLFVSGVCVRTYGLENIDKNKSYVFVANHSSYYDIPAVFKSIPNNLRIMYKKELEKIPFFGWYLKKSDFIGIEREEATSARNSLNEALRLIQQDVSVLIFPEGTRSPDGKLKEFKKGAMFLAIRSGKPIVPVAIIGTRKILPRGSFFIRTGLVKVIVGKPIDVPRDFGKMEMVSLTKFVHNELDSLLKINQSV